MTLFHDEFRVLHSESVNNCLIPVLDVMFIKSSVGQLIVMYKLSKIENGVSGWDPDTRLYPRFTLRY